MWRAVRFSIVAVWVVLVGVLVRQQWGEGGRPVTGVPTPAAVAPIDEWMGVYHSGAKIGYAHLAVRPEADGHRFEEESLLRLTVLETPQTVRTIIRAQTGKDFALHGIEFELVNGDSVFRVKGELAGETLHLTTTIGDDISTASVAVGGPIYLPHGVRRLVAAGPLVAGRRYESSVFDPFFMKELRLVSIVRGREVVPGTTPPREAWRLEEEYGGVTAVAWLDDDGRVVREEGPMGLAMVRETQEQAVTGNWSGDTVGDLVVSVAIPVEPRLDDPQGRLRLRLRVGGIAPNRVPADERQAVEGDVVTVVREDLPDRASFTLPYAGDQWRRQLAATPLLQSDHPRIRALASEVVGGEREPQRAARRLQEFVFRRLRKVPTVIVPNALQVLDAGEGDCNEHATLFAALARAAGLPARVVAGVVYIDGAFYYHAWNEVWLDRWISLDPVLDQFPADVTHVKFAAGGPEEQLEMIGIVGRLRLDVIADDAG